jgi:membrane protease YdiL (CAAX protease family)
MRTIVQGAHPPAAVRVHRLRRWASDHPYAAITALAVTGGWAAIGLPILASRGVLPGGWLVHASPIDVEKTAALTGMVVMLAGALWIAEAADGPGRVALVAARALHWRIGVWSWALAVIALPVTTVVAGVVLGRSPDLSPGALIHQLAALAVAVVVINLAEEVMWAGLVQTRLETHLSLGRAALLTAVPFALLHLPLRFVDAELSIPRAFGELAALIVLGFAIRLLFGLALRGLGDSLLALAVFHASFNSANNEEGIGATVLGADHQGFAMLAVLGVMAGLAIVRRNLLGVRNAQNELVS